MPKEKNYKRLLKNAVEDKINNIVFIMKFLNSKGGVELVEDYFANAIPSYVLEFGGVGGAKKWIMRQWLKRSARGYMEKIANTILEDSEWINPPENYEWIEDDENQMVLKLKCNYRKRLIKAGKKFKCEFDIRDYYCNHACIPILIKIYSDLYLKINVTLTKEGCLQSIEVDKATFSKDSKDDVDIKENVPDL